MTDLRNRLVTERARRGETVDEAAAHIGISGPMFARYERGESAPTSKRAPLIAEYLQISHEQAVDLILDAQAVKKETNSDDDVETDEITALRREVAENRRRLGELTARLDELGDSPPLAEIRDLVQEVLDRIRRDYQSGDG